MRDPRNRCSAGESTSIVPPRDPAQDSRFPQSDNWKAWGKSLIGLPKHVESQWKSAVPKELDRISAPRGRSIIGIC